MKLEKAKEDSEIFDQGRYQSAVGSLLYLSIGTRPDITYAVSNVARYCARPTTEHWMANERIIRYLIGTLDCGLFYCKDGSKKCIGFSDADWGGDINDRKSTSGYLFQISGAAVSWRSKKQTCVALSTAEAEYMALASAAQEAIWLRQLMADLNSRHLVLQSYLKIISLQSAWRKTRNSMAERNILGLSTISFESK